MQIIETSVVGVRSAVVALARPQTPLRFLLVPMVHLGLPTFYRAVTERLRRCQLVVAEGSDGPTSVGYAYVLALRITRQRAAAELVHQDIDYTALGVPTVFPDRLRRRPAAARRTRGRPGSPTRRIPLVGWPDVALFVPPLVLTMAVGGRDWLFRNVLDVNDDHTPRLPRYLLPSLTQDARDRDLLAALDDIHATRCEEAIDVAVVYGAGHMPAVVQHLRSAFDYRPQRGGEWLTVMRL